jgi:nucleoside-diphosphate-sugar epimerase
MAALALHQLVGGKSGETYDLGGTEAISLVQLAQTVVAKAGRPLEIRVNTAGREVSAARLVPHMNKSISSFGFKPAFSVAEAVERTLAWHSLHAGRRAEAR